MTSITYFYARSLFIQKIGFFASGIGQIPSHSHPQSYLCLSSQSFRQRNEQLQLFSCGEKKVAPPKQFQFFTQGMFIASYKSGQKYFYINILFDSFFSLHFFIMAIQVQINYGWKVDNKREKDPLVSTVRPQSPGEVGMLHSNSHYFRLTLLCMFMISIS